MHNHYAEPPIGNFKLPVETNGKGQVVNVTLFPEIRKIAEHQRNREVLSYVKKLERAKE